MEEYPRDTLDLTALMEQVSPIITTVAPHQWTSAEQFAVASYHLLVQGKSAALNQLRGTRIRVLANMLTPVHEGYAGPPDGTP
jgi:hypothetical protein